jgi:hypothetical protein
MLALTASFVAPPVAAQNPIIDQGSAIRPYRCRRLAFRIDRDRFPRATPPRRLTFATSVLHFGAARVALHGHGRRAHPGRDLDVDLLAHRGQRLG